MENAQVWLEELKGRWLGTIAKAMFSIDDVVCNN